MMSQFAVIKFGCLCVVAWQTGCAAAVPLAVVRAASQCAATPDAFDCLLRAAAAGVDSLARSAEPVDLVPGCVTLVKNAAADADPAPATATTTTDAVVTATAAARKDDGAAVISAEAALVDSVTAFAKSRAISVRAPAYLLDSLKSTLIEGKPF